LLVEIADLYPYWARERDALTAGLRQVADRVTSERSPEDAARIFDWTPPGGNRSINDLLRHIAYVEDYIIDKLVMDHEPKTILKGSVFPADEFPTFDACMHLLHDVHDRTKIAFQQLTRERLRCEIPAFRRTLPVDRLLWSIVQEEAHHRGQIYLLLRMQDIAPPERKD
jgi:uncharacterized damage-inducible protein DinB